MLTISNIYYDGERVTGPKTKEIVMQALKESGVEATVRYG